MGYRDIELLAAASGNQEKYNQICFRLQQYANSVARALFSSPVLREDAVQKAIDKAGDWLGTNSVLHVDHPWAYVKRIVANSLLDSAKTRKVEGMNLDDKLFAGETVKQAMAWVDEGFTKLDYEGNDEDQIAGSGWRLFQIIDESHITLDTEHWYPHKWVRGLNQLFDFQWWWGIDKWLDKFEGEYKVKRQSFRIASFEAHQKIKEYNVKLWSKYNLINALIDSITGKSEKQIMLFYLWGFKPVDIARELSVSKPYISRVLNQKWLKIWGWDEPAVYQARLILLTHYLADQYEQTLCIADKRRMRNMPSQVPELLKEFNELGDEWRRSILPVLDTLESEDESEEDLPEELRDKAREIDKKRNDLEDRIRAEYRELAKRPRMTNNDLYKKIISSPQTKFYFHDLDRFESDSLVSICAWYWRNWYPDKITFEHWWQHWWYGDDD